jgi:hypothetical protein
MARCPIFPAFSPLSGGAASTAPRSVEVSQGMTACGTGESCIMVDRSCGLCCDYVAINAREEALFNKMSNQACASYRGPACNKCPAFKVYPSCVNNKCTLVKWPSPK